MVDRSRPPAPSHSITRLPFPFFFFFFSEQKALTQAYFCWKEKKNEPLLQPLLLLLRLVLLLLLTLCYIIPSVSPILRKERIEEKKKKPSSSACSQPTVLYCKVFLVLQWYLKKCRVYLWKCTIEVPRRGEREEAGKGIYIYIYIQSNNMILIDGQKYACERCIKAHRVKYCDHKDAELVKVKPKGRPSTSCLHCKDLRYNRNINPTGACACGSNKRKESLSEGDCTCDIDNFCHCYKSRKSANAKNKVNKTPVSPDNSSTNINSDITLPPLSIDDIGVSLDDLMRDIIKSK